MVSPTFLPSMGGVETHVAEVAPRLRRAGIEVEILTTDKSGRLPEREVIEGVPVRRVVSYPRDRDYGFAPGLLRIIASRRWDLIHCQGIHTLVPPLAMLGAGARHVPFVVTLHTGGHSSVVRNGLRMLQWLALAPLLRRADRLIAVSAFEASIFEVLPGVDPHRIEVISNGADVPSKVGPAAVVDPDLVLSVGRLERYKGHQKVIAALPEVILQRPKAHLRIAGAGPYAMSLHHAARAFGVEDRVEIAAVPPGDGPAMANLMSRAAVIVLLSDYESQGLAVLEALALGRPVVVTDATALHEYVATGLARGVPTGSQPSDIGATIVAAIEAGGGSPLVVPSWDECAQGLLSIYEAVGKGKDRPRPPIKRAPQPASRHKRSIETARPSRRDRRAASEIRCAWTPS